MAVLACLGRANYWMTIPFCVVLSVIALAMVVVPDRLPGKPPPRRWMGRALGVLLLVGIWAFAIPSALHEARTGPDCEMEASASPR